MIAIIPAAGKGTRMASLTGGRPKELLPLGSRRILGRIIEEAKEAGAARTIIVNSRSKPDIDLLAQKEHVEVTHQETPKGLADAILSADVEGDCLILLGDAVFHGGSPATRMANLVFRGIDGCIAVEPVDEATMSLYGIVEVNEGNGAIQRILEKPKPADTPSRYAVAARYAFSGRFMAFLNDYVSSPEVREQEGEIGITEVINAAIEAGYDLKAVALAPDQKRVDCGSPEEYQAARLIPWD